MARSVRDGAHWLGFGTSRLARSARICAAVVWAARGASRAKWHRDELVLSPTSDDHAGEWQPTRSGICLASGASYAWGHRRSSEQRHAGGRCRDLASALPTSVLAEALYACEKKLAGVSTRRLSRTPHGKRCSLSAVSTEFGPDSLTVERRHLWPRRASTQNSTLRTEAAAAGVRLGS